MESNVMSNLSRNSLMFGTQRSNSLLKSKAHKENKGNVTLCKPIQETIIVFVLFHVNFFHVFRAL